MSESMNAQNSVMFFNPATNDMRMSIETFRDMLAEDVTDNISDDIRTVKDESMKPNTGKYLSLAFLKEGSDIGPIINISELYEVYNSGVEYGDILEKITDIVKNTLVNKDVENFSCILLDYESARERLYPQVISADDPILEKVPNRKIGNTDLCVIYRVSVLEDKNGIASAIVRNESLIAWGISEEQLYEDTITAATKNRPLLMEGVFEMMKRMGAVPPWIEDDVDDALVVCNAGINTIHGAGVITYPDFFEKAQKKLKSDSFWMIPSSIDEVIILSENSGMDPSYMKEMVMFVNEDAVTPENKLSDNVYHYDGEAKLFEIADDYIKRKERSDD